MMDQRLLRQLRMAHGHHTNRPAKQGDQQASHGNDNKENAPPKLEDKANRHQKIPAQARWDSTVKIEGIWASSVWSRASYMLPAIRAVKVMRQQFQHDIMRYLTFLLQQRRGNRS